MADSQPPTQIGPYRIIRLIAEGGMGAVYEAVHESIERRVAVKVLLPEYAQRRDAVTRFFNEARAVNRIEHPSIVQVSEFGETPDGTAYLVMEYVRGEPLTNRLASLQQSGRKMGVLEALQLAAQLADALSVAHDKGIVHRDMKPGNVMLARDSAVPGGERAKILDFGIAKLMQPSTRGTATDVVMGTPQYMSPEQCRGAGGVDDRTDVYALGVMLYEMLAARTPFLGEGSGDFIGQHMFKEPPPLRKLAPKVPAEVVAFVHRLLIKDKAVRPAMAEVVRELVRLLSRLSGSLPAQPFIPADPERTAVATTGSPSTLGHSLGQTMRSGRSPRRLLLLAGVGLAVAATCAGLASQVLHRSSRQPAAPSVAPPNAAHSPAVPPPPTRPTEFEKTSSPPPPVLKTAPALERPSTPVRAVPAKTIRPTPITKPPVSVPTAAPRPKRPFRFED